MNEFYPVTEHLLGSFREELGKEYQSYSNHVCRVFLNCLLLDNNPANAEKYAIAAVFHDIGIWTNNTLDYLDPSIEQAEIYLTENSRTELVEEIAAMITWHHKTAPYQGNYAQTVETFRRADWIDVTLGFRNFGVSRAVLKENRRKLPNMGFHLFLFKGVLKYALRNPFHPLPMFR